MRIGARASVVAFSSPTHIAAASLVAHVTAFAQLKKLKLLQVQENEELVGVLPFALNFKPAVQAFLSEVRSGEECSLMMGSPNAANAISFATRFARRIPTNLLRILEDSTTPYHRL